MEDIENNSIGATPMNVSNTNTNMHTNPNTHINTTSSEHQVYSFGQNSYGELAHGDTQERYAPKLVEFCKTFNVVDIVCGNEHTAVLCENGEVYTCGYNDSGQCGIGTTHRVTSPKVVRTLTNKRIIKLNSANGCEHLAAISESGELFTFGYNARGQLGHGMTSPVAVPTKVDGFTNKRVTKVACSYFHTVVVTENDEVYAFGRNDFGQLGTMDGVDKHVPHCIDSLRGQPVLSVACGQYHTIVSLASGGIYSFGKNDYGQLGIESVEARSSQSVSTLPLIDEIIVQVACGYYHTVALSETGRVFTFGRNDYGQLGLGHKQNKWKPTVIPFLEDIRIVQVACGCYHTLALSEEGKVYPFGRNNHGQLGINNSIDSPIPQLIDSLRDERVQKVAAGFYHSVCLTGTPECTTGPLPNTLSYDLRTMLNNSSRSDVTFVVSGEPIYAHRCIIMARCEPLEIMLDGPMREAQQSEIIIPEHSYEVFLAFLEFIYTDEVQALSDPTDVDFVLDLLALSDQFLMNVLKRKCEVAIQKSITTENVSLMFRTADARQVTGLRKRCSDFIMSHFGDVIGTKCFSELPQDLLQEILFDASRRGVSIKCPPTL